MKRRLTLLLVLAGWLAGEGCGRQADEAERDRQLPAPELAVPSEIQEAQLASDTPLPQEEQDSLSEASLAHDSVLAEEIRGLTQLEQRCMYNNDAASCLAAAEILRDRDGDAAAGALPLYVRACELGEPSGAGCVGAGDHHLYKSFSSEHDTQAHVNAALAYYRRACDGEEAPASAAACLALGSLYAEKERRYSYQNYLTLDEARAFYYLDKACQLDSERGCLFAADLLSSGTGVARDEQAARRMYDKACTLGSHEACARNEGEMAE